MTPDAFRSGLAALNLTQTQAAPLWGVSLSTLQRWVRAPELASAAPVPGKAATLMAAYLAGFRPDGWPVGEQINQRGSRI